MQDCCVKCFSSPALGHQTTHVCANARTVEGARRKRCGGHPLLPYQISRCNRYWIAEAYRRVASEIAPASNVAAGNKSAIGEHLSCSIFISSACVRSRVSRRQAPWESALSGFTRRGLGRIAGRAVPMAREISEQCPGVSAPPTGIASRNQPLPSCADLYEGRPP